MDNFLSAEAYLAGALLVDDQSIQVVRGLVRQEDFSSEILGAIFSAALALDRDGETVDPVSVQKRALRNGTDLPGSLITDLMVCTPTAANCAEYAHRVAEDARVRRIKELAEQIQGDEASSSDELLTHLQREVEAIRGSNFQRGLLSPSDTLSRFMDHVVDAGSGRDNFVASGFPRLDSILGGGFIRSGLYILGARPAMGKSTFAITLADNIAGSCLLVSLEMSPEQILAKRVSRLTGITSAKLLSGRVTDNDWQQIAQATTALSGQGVYLNGRYDLTVQQIQLLAQAVPNLRAVVVDYLGLIKAATPGGSTYENVSAISRELKRMAISLDVPVICLCQLSRSVEGREDKRPRLSDLRDSGAIEQDADGVMLLFRPDYYSGGPEDGAPSLVHLDIAKNRYGRTGAVGFNCWLASSTFKEIS